MSGDKLWELSDPKWHCPECGASASEIRRAGHRRLDPDTGEWWPRLQSIPPSQSCPEACTCIPEHRSLAEHRVEMDAQDLAAALK